MHDNNSLLADPFALSSEEIEQGRVFFSSEVNFLFSAGTIKDLDECETAELGFVGCSNVGKSSLLNALCHRKQLAFTSSKPGRTQTLNFFALKHRQYPMRLVDMPGYGYAKQSKTLAHSWQNMMRDYLRGRRNLFRVCLLIDARRGFRAHDRDHCKLLDDAGVSYYIILTKCDQLPKAILPKRVAELESELSNFPAAFPKILKSSSRTKEGLEFLRAVFCRDLMAIMPENPEQNA